MNPQNLKTGDVLHCQGRSILSKLIKWATGSQWSHTAIFIEMWGQPFVVEAQRRGVFPKHYNEWVKKYGYYYEVHRNPSAFDHKEFSLKAMSVSGTKYDFFSLLVRHPFKILTGRWKKQKSESHKFYCSEYAAWCHSIEHGYRMTPDDMYSYCVVNDWDVVE